ncbi:MAG: cell wall hydrolase [Firmicutes bacterium]|nr:cell wall hydrolase [Bacillota bacterium]
MSILRYLKPLIFAAAVMLAGSPGVAAGASAPDENLRPDVRLIIDGRLTSPPIRPIIVNDSPYLPLRYISEKRGAKVGWDTRSKTAAVSLGGKELDTGGILVDGVLMVGPDFFRRMFSLETAFYGEYDIIVMSSNGKAGIMSADDALKLTPTYNGYSRDDLNWLSKIVEAEASGEKFASRLAVANVIINRKNADGFPSTIKGVIFDRSCGVQFTPTSNGAIYNTPSGESYLAAVEALEGKNNAVGALFFYNPKYATSNWISRHRKYAFTLGGHEYRY